MKIHSRILALAVIAGLALTVAANSFDLFNSSRTAVVTPPAKLAMTGTTASLATNVVDKIGFDGIGILTLTVCSNSADVAVDPTLILNIEDSPDTTNYTVLSTIATAVQTSLSYTNTGLGVGTNIAVTDVFLLPGTLTTPTAATAGFATPYISPAAFTSLGTITNTSASKAYQYGINLRDTQRYLRIRYSLNGSNANYSVGATLTGFRGNDVR